MSATPPTEVHPGQVWWCDGLALGFEAHFKRRPVLLLEARGGETLLVAPLSSRRRFGQETRVTHDGGASYLTGRAAEVPRAALLAPLGFWEGFAAWQETQRAAAEGAARAASWRERIRRWFE